MSAAPPLRIAIAGAAGRMGVALLRAAGEGVCIVGGTERPGSDMLGQDIGERAGLGHVGVAPVEDPAIAAATADVWIDFTTPAAMLASLPRLAATQAKACVLGTTGLTAAQEAEIAAHAGRLAIVRDANFSLGVNLLLALVEQAAERLGPDWDIEIAETHHRRKVDAPSGTALRIGEAAAKGRGGDLPDLRSPPYDGQTGPRTPGRIGFSVQRGGSVIGDHTASFISDEEMLTLSHRALDRAVFARGAMRAAVWVAGRPPGLYSMRDVLDL